MPSFSYNRLLHFVPRVLQLLLLLPFVYDLPGNGGRPTHGARIPAASERAGLLKVFGSIEAASSAAPLVAEAVETLLPPPKQRQLWCAVSA